MRGGWIEIEKCRTIFVETYRPTPCGVGGLKYSAQSYQDAIRMSHPMRGGWIEMVPAPLALLAPGVSHPMRGGWIEITKSCLLMPTLASHPMRGGWIEIIIALDGTPLACASHPMRGGWIEIVPNGEEKELTPSPTPYGVGGLKYSKFFLFPFGACSPTPYGVGGLKFW